MARVWGIIKIVLPASQSSNPPTSQTSPSDNRALVFAVVALMVYSFALGLAFLLGWIGIGNAYLLIALACLVPVAWYLYGFLKERDVEQDFGLLLSALGWFLLALGFLLKDAAWRASQALLTQGVFNPNGDNTPIATVCFVLAVLCLAIGAALSYSAWRREQERF